MKPTLKNVVNRDRAEYWGRLDKSSKNKIGWQEKGCK